MSMMSIPPRQPRRSRVWVWLFSIILFILLVFGGVTAYLTIEKNRPNDEYVTLEFNGLDRPVFYQGELLDYNAVGEGEGLKLPFDIVKAFIDPAVIYEESTQSVIVTTAGKVVRMKTDQLTAMVNEEPISIRFPVEMIDGLLYLPMEPLLEYYNIVLRVSEETGAVFIYNQGDLIQWGKVLAGIDRPEKSVPMRTRATIKAPIAADLEPQERVMILQEESNGWYHVQLENGYKGYMDKSKIQMDQVEVIPIQAADQTFMPWKPMGEKINLTWEHVVTKTLGTEEIGEMPGLNVVSPTWFHLEEDANGNMYVKNLADPAYVRWAHDREYQVWALFSNSFKPDLTSKALASYDTRMMMIKQLLSYAKMYNLQGINIDFENVYLKDKELFTQFVREMTPFLHEQGLVVSVDVTIRGGSEMYSLFADRRELGKVVDYMMVMTYDEHWASSPIAGSVASLSWTEKGIVDIMREDDVPASKLLLGVPYYARVWTEELVDGKIKVSSSAKYMSGIRRIIRENNLEPQFLEDVGQNYVEYKDGDKTIKIWIEDEISMKARIELVNKYDLAGVASWRRGFEDPEIWNVIQNTLEQRP
jgi:spore germination protein YaaH